MNRPSQPVWHTLVAIVVSVLVTAGAALYIADRSARRSEQRWCGLIATLDDAYSVSPPTTEIGRKLAQDIGELRQRFGCTPRVSLPRTAVLPVLMVRVEEDLSARSAPPYPAHREAVRAAAVAGHPLSVAVLALRRHPLAPDAPELDAVDPLAPYHQVNLV